MEKVENIQIVQDLYAALADCNLSAILALLADDVEWHFTGDPAVIPFAGHCQGRATVVDFFATLAATVQVLAFGPHEVIGCDDHVVTIGQAQVRVKATSRIYETDWTHLVTVRHGKIVRLREFSDTACIAAAFRSA